jgi:hypothetical protein
MTSHFPKLTSILDFVENLRSSIESGNPSRELKYKPDLVIEKLNEAREKLVEAQKAMDRMENDPQEVMDRMAKALSAIDNDYPKETKFLKILVEQKLAPEEFHNRMVELMCDLSDAQNGLVGPNAALAAVNNYVEVLDLLRNDKTLSAEMDKLIK